MNNIPDTSVQAIGAIADRMLERAGDSQGARKIHAEVQRIRSAAEGLDEFNRNRSPHRTQATHTVEVAKRARSFDREVTALINRAAATCGAARKEIEQRIADKINLKPDDYAREIRDRFWSMGAKAKTDYLNELVEQNRGPELAAIVLAPPGAVGITKERQDKYAHVLKARHAAAELDELSRVDEALEATFTVVNTVTGYVKRLTAPSLLEPIERAEAASAAASQAFEQALQ